MSDSSSSSESLSIRSDDILSSSSSSSSYTTHPNKRSRTKVWILVCFQHIKGFKPVAAEDVLLKTFRTKQAAVQKLICIVNDWTGPDVIKKWMDEFMDEEGGVMPAGLFETDSKGSTHISANASLDSLEMYLQFLTSCDVDPIVYKLKEHEFK